MVKLIRITTAPLSLDVLLKGQMRFMQANGFEVVMVSSEGRELDTVKEFEGCRHEVIPMTRKITPLTDIKCLWLMYRLFKKEKPDIVHSHTPKAGLIAMLAAKFAGVKLRIHTIAGLRFMTSKGMSRKILVFMEKLTARAATHVWPNSFSLLGYIQQHRLVNSKKLEVIGKGSSNGIDLSRYSLPALNKNTLLATRQHVKYEEGLIYFLSVGRLVHDKGIDELVHGFLKIHKDNERTRLILVGAFEDEVDPVSDDTKTILHSHPAIILAGWSNAVEYYMEFAFALVHPSHREGFPNVILQAGAMECPVICSRIEGNVDIVEHEKTGLIFSVNDENELVARMRQALDRPQLVQKYALELRRKIEDHFDQPVIHRQIRKRYLQILGIE
jgi:glycosyltransferase involved in cell wall biosynthesis